MVEGLRIEIDEVQIADFCRRWHIRKLSLFGSVVRGDFRPDSDVDVLVEFEEGTKLGLAFFDMKAEIEGIFGRPVDLVELSLLRNPFRRHEILRTHVPVYAA